MLGPLFMALLCYLAGMLVCSICTNDWWKR
jgi:hypothetical protein